MPSQVGYETADSGHEATGAPSAGGKSTLVVVVSTVSNCRQTLGRTLHWDEKTWTVKNDPEANKLLTREYRAPYIVPAKV